MASCNANVCWVGAWGVSVVCAHDCDEGDFVLNVVSGPLWSRWVYEGLGVIVAIICMSNDFWVIVFWVSNLYDLGPLLRYYGGLFWWPAACVVV